MFILFSSYFSENKENDDMGWKAKLKLPPKDNRIKTSVS